MATPNGLGHLTRLLNILAEAGRRRPIRATVVAASWQRTVRAGEGADPPWLSWCEDVFEPEVRHLPTLPDLDVAGDRWGAKLRACPDVRRADVVLSDNLASTLAARPDAVLIGSFLWSDVVPGTGFAARERELLAQHRPIVLANRWLATDLVRAEPGTRLTGWTAARGPVLPVEARSVELNVGTTGVLSRFGAAVADRLDAVGWTVRGTPSVRDAAGSGHIRPRRTDRRPVVAVTRPAMQSVSEYVAAGVPMALIYEPANAEMRLNARQLVAAGLATDLGGLPVEQVAAALAAVPVETLAVQRARALAMPSTGIDEIIDVIGELAEGDHR